MSTADSLRPQAPCAAPLTTAAPASKREGQTVTVLLAGSFMVVLDFFIVNVSLPAMQQQLGANDTQTQWFVVAYGLAYACTLVASGRLGDLFGHRQCYRLGLLLFMLSSAVCGLAAEAIALTLARAAQGLGAALVSPQVLVLLGRLLARERQPWAFSWYGLVLGVASTGGQLLGGALMALASADWGWRLCFLVNLPICAGALVLSGRVLPPDPPRTVVHADRAGMVTICLAMVLLVFPIVEGREAGWPLWTWLCLTASVVCFGWFGRRQKKLADAGRAGILPPELWSHRSFVIGLIATLAFYAGNASFYYVLALYLQRGLSLSPMQAGWVFACLAGGFMATTLNAQRIKARLGARGLPIGALLLATGHLLQWLLLGSESAQAPLVPLCVILAIEGLGIGMVMAPLVATIVSLLPPAYAGVASGLMTTTQQAGNALGVALIGVVFYAAHASTSSHPTGPTDLLIHYTSAFRHSLLYLIVVAALTWFCLRRLTRGSFVYSGR